MNLLNRTLLKLQKRVEMDKPTLHFPKIVPHPADQP